MSKTTPAQFIRQVKQEASKVTWGTRKETITSTAVVLVMIVITACFFWLVDVVILNGIQAIIGF